MLVLVRQLKVVLHPAGHVRDTGLHAHDRVKIDIAIRQMESQQPSFGKLRSIDPKGFTSQQVNRYGIRAENIEYNELIMPIRSLLEP